MAEISNFPRTNAELAELGQGSTVRFPGTEAEYWMLAEESELRLDFFKNEIIASMSYESDVHSAITSRINYLLQTIFQHNSNFRIHNSNRPVCIPDCNNAIFNLDGSVIQLPAQFYEYRPGMTAELTPVLVFEVLSNSTRVRDLGEKLVCCKRIASIHHIIYVDTENIQVNHFEKMAEDQWLETFYTDAADVFLINEQEVGLKDVYKGTLA